MVQTNTDMRGYFYNDQFKPILEQKLSTVKKIEEKN